MAWTQIDIDALKAAIALGVKRVKYGDKDTEFQSLEEMMQLLAAMEADVNGVPTIQQRRRMGIFTSTLNGCWPWRQW